MTGFHPREHRFVARDLPPLSANAQDGGVEDYRNIPVGAGRGCLVKVNYLVLAGLLD